MLIAFSGVDCSGKSTHIEWLQNYFISSGKTCTTLWYRPGYSKEMQTVKDTLRAVHHLAQWPIDLVLDKASKLNAIKTLVDSQKSSAKSKAAAKDLPKSDLDASDAPKADSDVDHASEPPASIIPAPLWLTTALLDTAIQWGIKLRYLQKRYDVVICDRYFEDARLDLLFKYPDYHFADKLLLAMQAYLPKPDHYFVLSLPFEAVLERAKKKVEPFPEDDATRKRRFRAYERVNFGPNTHVIDTVQSIEAVHHEILMNLAKV